MFANSLPLYFWVYFAPIIAFALFAYDKHCAHYGKRRIPEYILFAVSLALGAFGSLCGMIIFRHKTLKKLFYIGVPLMLFAQILILAYILTR